VAAALCAVRVQEMRKMHGHNVSQEQNIVFRIYSVEVKKMVSVIVIDDSAFMRRMLMNILETDPELKVIDTAATGQEGITKTSERRPEVVTLDLQLPDMEGLEVLKRILVGTSTHVVVISEFTKEGGEASSIAKEMGAAAVIQKPSGTASSELDKMKSDLVYAIKQAAKLPKRDLEETAKKLESKSFSVDLKATSGKVASRIVLIGGSTGAPQNIEFILKRLSSEVDACLVIIQQAPKKMTQMMVDKMQPRIEGSTAFKVKVIENGDMTQAGFALLCPKDAHAVMTKKNTYKLFREGVEPYMPSIDLIMASSAFFYKNNTIGVILPGDGKDGMKGMAVVKKLGGKTLVQDPKSCSNKEMPQAAIDKGAAEFVLSLEGISDKINELLKK